ncbi:helix-turn-helix domain-containing protein [Haloglomus litoreum]|uniref:helix-turn-helix domain-containing protein n=1 Tax=Haloglomus litoreum TaxID=3034026 RepID=UPI0023E80D36|nr:helix-turn-helix domain-containing protein [Haloglomus sp. DT116]
MRKPASSPLASSNAVHARVVIRPVRDCPITRLAGEFGIRELVSPGEHSRAPQVVVESAPEERLVDLGAHPIVRAGDGTVCRLPSLARTDGDVPTACGHGHCLGHGFGFLPIDPYHTRWEGDALRCSFAALDTREVERVIESFGAADYVVELEQLIRAGDDAPEGVSAASETTILDVDELTARQREVARAAVERGYFDPDGPSAAEVADELGIAKATLSEHLRAVQRELVRQAFAMPD